MNIFSKAWRFVRIKGNKNNVIRERFRGKYEFREREDLIEKFSGWFTKQIGKFQCGGFKGPPYPQAHGLSELLSDCPIQVLSSCFSVD